VTSTKRNRADHAHRIKTSDAEYAFDIIIYATGFDAITGSFDRIDIRGADGLRLKDKWAGGRRPISACWWKASPT